MFEIGFGECVVVLLVALFVLGPKQLTTVAERFGKVWGVWRRTWQQMASAAEGSPTVKPAKAVEQDKAGHDTAV
jgi:Sec-independent protein translocase protein TatA